MQITILFPGTSYIQYDRTSIRIRDQNSSLLQRRIKLKQNSIPSRVRSSSRQFRKQTMRGRQRGYIKVLSHRAEISRSDRQSSPVDFSRLVKIAGGTSGKPFLARQIAPHRKTRHGLWPIDPATCANIRFPGNTPSGFN